MKATPSYLSLIGGSAESGQVVGSVIDPRYKNAIPTLQRGRPAVTLAVDTYSTEGFDIYFLPWKANNTVTMQLGGGSRFFVTAAMSGCTFQVSGSPSAPVVSHANAGGTTQQRKVAFMDSQLKLAMQRHANDVQGTVTTRLQTGLWGKVNEGGIVETNYAADPLGARKRHFEQRIQQASQTVPGRDIVETEIDGDYKPITVAGVGFRPLGSNDWEFWYQVWADFSVNRRVYREQKKLFGGRKRKLIEKSKTADFIMLVPGAKLCPGGRGWPDTRTQKVQTARRRRYSL